MKIHFPGPVFTLSIALMASGCAATLTPAEVSDRFWTAVQQKDYNTAGRYVTAESRDMAKNTDDYRRDLDIKNVSFGKILIDHDKAWVDTVINIQAPTPYQVPLKTRLIQEDKQWKVDLASTMSGLSRDDSIAGVLDSLDEFSKMMNEKIEGSLDQIQKSLPQIQERIGTIEKKLNQKLPELRQRMDDIMQQLDGIINTPKNDPGSSSGKKEI